MFLIRLVLTINNLLADLLIFQTFFRQMLENSHFPPTKLSRYTVFSILGGGNAFSKLDHSQAYQQLRLAGESKDFTTFNTIRSCFSLQNCLGVLATPSVLVSDENLLKGIPNVSVYLDLFHGHLIRPGPFGEHGYCFVQASKQWFLMEAKQIFILPS